MIDKSVDKTFIDIAAGGTATFNYTVKVTPDGYVDSGWAVAERSRLPTPMALPIAGVNVTDAIDNGGTCTVTGGTNVTVPANGNVALDYTCTYAARRARRAAPTRPRPPGTRQPTDHAQRLCIGNCSRGLLHRSAS